MRSFCSFAVHWSQTESGLVYRIRRSDPTAAIEKTELPEPGETVLIDGEEKKVIRAAFEGSRTFWPYINITVSK